MTYTPNEGTNITTIQQMVEYVKSEFRSISQELQETPVLESRTISQAPDKPREGMIISADGTNFDPGSGPGAYVYQGGVWVPLSVIAAGSVTNAKLANMVQATLKGREVGVGTGVPEDLTSAQATAILGLFSSTLQGLVPASGGGTLKFLRADGVWTSSGYQLLNTINVTNQATIGDTTSFLIGYNHYLIELDNVIPITNNTQLQIQLQVGGTFQTTSYQGGALTYSGAASGNIGNPGSSSNITDVNCANSSPGVSGEIHISRPRQTTDQKLFWGHSVFNSTIAQVLNGTVFHGVWTGSNAAIDGFRLFFNSGNVAFGVVRVYGKM